MMEYFRSIFNLNMYMFYVPLGPSGSGSSFDGVQKSESHFDLKGFDNSQSPTLSKKFGLDKFDEKKMLKVLSHPLIFLGSGDEEQKKYILLSWCTSHFPKNTFFSKDVSGDPLKKEDIYLKTNMFYGDKKHSKEMLVSKLILRVDVENIPMLLKESSNMSIIHDVKARNIAVNYFKKQNKIEMVDMNNEKFDRSMVNPKKIDWCPYPASSTNDLIKFFKPVSYKPSDE